MSTTATTTTATPTLTTKQFSDEEHFVWSKLFDKQRGLLSTTNRVSRDVLDGYDRAWFTRDRIPHAQTTSDKLCATTWRTMVDANATYMTSQDRREQLFFKRMSVTDYIRPVDEIDFTERPDLFHEYFGHLPMLFNKKVADTAHRFGQLWRLVHNEQQNQEMYHLERYCMEYGVVLEDKTHKAFGAGLLSSVGDMNRLLSDEFMLVDAQLDEILATKPSVHVPHKKLFVFDWLDHINRLIDEYETRLRSA